MMDQTFVDHESVRVHKSTGEGSVLDVITVLSKDKRHSSREWKRMKQKYNLPTRKVKINGKGKSTDVASESTLKEIAAGYLVGVRMAIKTKHAYMQRFRLPATMTARVYIEEEIMPAIAQTFGHLCPIRQFPIGSYKVDLYFPAQRVVVECDEHGHKCYNEQQQHCRTTFISQQLMCKWYRFDPYQAGFDIHKTFSDVMQLVYQS